MMLINKLNKSFNFNINSNKKHMKKIILHNNTPKKEIKKADQIQITVSYMRADDRASLVFNQLTLTNNYTCKELSSGPFGGTYLFSKKN